MVTFGSKDGGPISWIPFLNLSGIYFLFNGILTFSPLTYFFNQFIMFHSTYVTTDKIYIFFKLLFSKEGMSFIYFITKRCLRGKHCEKLIDSLKCNLL